MKKILLVGGTGLIGKQLVNKLFATGYEVVLLTRNKSKIDNKNFFYWNFENQEIDIDAFKNVDIIINLAGENISNSRWTNAQKFKIEKSRVVATNFLFETVKSNNFSIETYVSASAIGFYGTYNSINEFSESDLAGNDFLASVCEKWEKAANKFSVIAQRVIILRTAVVLSKNYSAFQKLIQSLMFRTIVILGNGKQQVPFIHIDDLVAMYIFVIENQIINGIYNAVSPCQNSNAELMQEIKNQNNKFVFVVKIPNFILKLMFGEMSSILLYGSKINSRKIESEGFEFKFKTLKQNINNLMQN
jgi:uncharacterized protein (TIGR01777 family)